MISMATIHSGDLVDSDKFIRTSMFEAKGSHREEPRADKPPNNGDDSELPSSEGQTLSLLHSFDETVTDLDIPRYLRDNDSTLRFPVKAEREATKSGRSSETACVAWTNDGQGVILRTTEEFQRKILPLASSCGAKLLSFTRKLYRWGFRQARPKDHNKNVKQKIFCHPMFQRDNKPLMVGMKSTTAEGTKRALAAKRLIAIQETKTPEEQLEAHRPSTILDQHLLVRDSSRSSSSLALPIGTRPAPYHESMIVPSAGIDQSLRLAPLNAPHFIPSTISQVMAELEARTLHTSLGYFLPGTTLRSPNLNIMSLLRPNLLNQETGNYGQFVPSEDSLRSFRNTILQQP